MVRDREGGRVGCHCVGAMGEVQVLGAEVQRCARRPMEEVVPVAPRGLRGQEVVEDAQKVAAPEATEAEVAEVPAVQTTTAPVRRARLER